MTCHPGCTGWEAGEYLCVCTIVSPCFVMTCSIGLVMSCPGGAVVVAWIIELFAGSSYRPVQLVLPVVV